MVTINDSLIPFKMQHKFLGLVVDSLCLTWGRYIHYLVTSCLKMSNLIKSLAGVKWGADKHTFFRFFCAYIRSCLDYGCKIYGGISPSFLHKLDVIKNSHSYSLGGIQILPSHSPSGRILPILTVTLTLHPPCLHLHLTCILSQLPHPSTPSSFNRVSHHFLVPYHIKPTRLL